MYIEIITILEITEASMNWDSVQLSSKGVKINSGGCVVSVTHFIGPEFNLEPIVSVF